MKSKRNKRFVAFFIAISMFAGLLCGNGYTVAAEGEESSSAAIREQHERDGYTSITSTPYQSLPDTYLYETPTVKDADINLILDAINTNYKYMDFKGSEIDIVAEYLGNMHDYFGELKKGIGVTKYFGDKTLIYKPDSIGKGTLEFVNETEKIERSINVDFYSSDNEVIKAKLSENGNEIKDIVITEDNICTITNSNGERYKLSVEHESENSYYKITYSSIEDEREYISFEKSKEEKYRLIATENMREHYGLSLWYKEDTSEPTEKPTEETPTLSTSTPNNKPDVITSPVPSIKIKDSVTIKMGGKSIDFDDLIEGNAKVKGKITVNTKNKCIKINKAKKTIKAKYTKKKLPKKGVLITVKVGKQTKKVHVKVIVPKPKKKDIKIKSKLVTINGKKYNMVTFMYNFNKNTSIEMKLKNGKNNKFNDVLKKYVKGNKGYQFNKDVYITTPSRKKMITFKTRLKCGKNKSEWSYSKGVKLK